MGGMAITLHSGYILLIYQSRLFGKLELCTTIPELICLQVQMAALDLFTNPSYTNRLNNLTIFTYGSPRALSVEADDLLTKLLRKSLGQHHRVVRVNDPVVRLPPRFLGYTHPRGANVIWLNGTCDGPHHTAYVGGYTERNWVPGSDTESLRGYLISVRRNIVNHLHYSDRKTVEVDKMMAPK